MNVISRAEGGVEHTKRAIQPGLISETIREPPVRSTNGDVDDQIEGYLDKVSTSVHPA